MKNNRALIKNIMEHFINRLEEAEDLISKLEDRVGKNTQSEQKQEKN